MLYVRALALLSAVLVSCAVSPERDSRTGRRGIRVLMTSIFVSDPVAAHAFYTEVLGFASKQIEPAAQVAIVVSRDEPDGTQLLLEPRGAGFAKDYQDAVFKAGLPHLILGVADLDAEIARLEAKGVRFRDDLTREAWGLENLFEDGFGNLLMLQANQ